MHLKSLKNKVSKRWQVWIRQGQIDLEAAKLSAKNGYYEWATFQSQQCVEKLLKSIIVQAGFRPPKIHKIAILMSFCNRVNEQFRNTKFDFREIESFTFISRYPFLIPGENSSPHDYITSEDADVCINQAEVLSKQVSTILDYTLTI